MKRRKVCVRQRGVRVSGFDGYTYTYTPREEEEEPIEPCVVASLVR